MPEGVSALADTDDFAGLLGKLLSADGSSDGGGDGIFGDIDMDMLLKLVDIFSKLGENNSSTELLMALKPHLREENRAKVDRAVMMMRLMNIIPLLRESGLAENLFS